MSKPIMDESCLADELANLRAENLALAERLRQTSDVREIVSRLRDIRQWLSLGRHCKAGVELNDLLRRLDVEDDDRDSDSVPLDPAARLKA